MRGRSLGVVFAEGVPDRGMLGLGAPVEGLEAGLGKLGPASCLRGRNDFHIGHYLRDLITKICRVTIGDLLFCLGGVLLNLFQLGCKICGDHTSA